MAEGEEDRPDVGLLCWNIAALNPTLKNVDLKYGSMAKLFETIHVDLACFQETKLNESQLTKDVVCVDGYQSYWAVSRDKKGYSGVVTYASERWGAVEAWADCLGSGESDIDREGRVVVSDHGAFVLINVYAPNAGERPARARLPFKLAFLEALKRKADEYRLRGREVLIVGDLNVAATAADVHPTIEFEGLYSAGERDAIESLVGESAPYVDIWRRLYPDATDVYTVWDERTSARAFNRGLRIDYAICTPGLLPHVSACVVVGTDILPPKWSDHAAILVRLHGLAPPPRPQGPPGLWLARRDAVVDSRQRSIRDMWVARPAKKARTAAAVADDSPPPDAERAQGPGRGSRVAHHSGEAAGPQKRPAKNVSGIARFFKPAPSP